MVIMVYLRPASVAGVADLLSLDSLQLGLTYNCRGSQFMVIMVDLRPASVAEMADLLSLDSLQLELTYNCRRSQFLVIMVYLRPASVAKVAVSPYMFLISLLFVNVCMSNAHVNVNFERVFVELSDVHLVEQVVGFVYRPSDSNHRII